MQPPGTQHHTTIAFLPANDLLWSKKHIFHYESSKESIAARNREQQNQPTDHSHPHLPRTETINHLTAQIPRRTEPTKKKSPVAPHTSSPVRTEPSPYASAAPANYAPRARGPKAQTLAPLARAHAPREFIYLFGGCTATASLLVVSSSSSSSRSPSARSRGPDTNVFIACEFSIASLSLLDSFVISTGPRLYTIPLQRITRKVSRAAGKANEARPLIKGASGLDAIKGPRAAGRHRDVCGQ